ncbi:hypothetical protein GCM10022247_38240 [Allokutzneria multivorans]|uniref:Uncharacterized protein n=1 Tax=Allokutzneria multivorans TaxID=1142134 RepID=A0ABP7SI94_9PSEU
MDFLGSRIGAAASATSRSDATPTDPGPSHSACALAQNADPAPGADVGASSRPPNPLSIIVNRVLLRRSRGLLEFHETGAG